MEFYKTIFSGRLEFGTQRSFEKVYNLYLHRVENYYRNSILLDAEEIFDEESYCLDIPRKIVQSTEKNWKNTTNMLNYIVQYAIAGSLRAWRTQEGTLIDELFVEPDSEKLATMAYIKGRKLLSNEGKMEDAKTAFDKAIKKFERHAMAYERRGKVNMKLNNLDDAVYDYNKSIKINPNAAEPYIGLAKVHYLKGDLTESVKYFDLATKKCIPHQPIYFKAKRMKGECHMSLKEYDKAMLEFKLFLKRKFNPGNTNIDWISNVYSSYGKCLLSLSEAEDAVEAFDNALKNQNPNSIGFDKTEALILRGMARQKAGINGYATDWKEAAGLGSEKAAELLQLHK